MTVKEHILALLDSNKGEYFSGEEIAVQLSVTRSAVWKAIKSLQTDGYSIQAVTNKGYSMSPQTDILSASAISKYLDTRGQKLRVEVFKTISSTNEAVKNLASNGEAEGKVILSEEQTAGRGRMGRKFFSPPGTGIYMSILLRPKLSATDSALLTTCAAVAVALSIESVSSKETQIKWVNDVFMEGKKVCGILTEASVSLENGWLDYAVLGIGINVVLPSEGFPTDLTEIATTVISENNPYGDLRNRLVAEVLNNFMRYYEHLTDRLFLSEYKKRLISLGEPVTVIKDNEQRKATAIDIDDDCHLKVRYENGDEEYLSSGEVSIKI
ncbi:MULTISPECIES: biotin--[acetyl-CoA-carboxylase] ligase [Paenibacillus]|uniref:biotin--[acetyl-CoA-carboxylase] ligase n=1 Tax=Paenibacillus TaxID=44249 RepID=UPI0004F8C040|nr:biotin--[acetyl-CoA-carboxylase] ligase [Paenibacillus odorifer]AIQ74552.1 biotin [Paenibacillus odorifer]MEC0134170.1 biotin--[acetyl-CoA-carboxylase] ligase [Paenibacillus odorifer]MEC0222545.1 biotin--[acetyl-CoA-carboxylase] ligase [Paenibacillus odorifer]OMC96809.1 biotin--[acetyl-CoA-carboxylase] ligase [Paenibacillus odorifer]OMD16056.1 biotin--[acetyl-CoA-carboxylase] ligase [Paenibacillus odorifer]